MQHNNPVHIDQYLDERSTHIRTKITRYVTNVWLRQLKVFFNNSDNDKYSGLPIFHLKGIFEVDPNWSDSYGGYLDPGQPDVVVVTVRREKLYSREKPEQIAWLSKLLWDYFQAEFELRKGRLLYHFFHNSNSDYFKVDHIRIHDLEGVYIFLRADHHLYLLPTKEILDEYELTVCARMVSVMPFPTPNFLTQELLSTDEDVRDLYEFMCRAMYR